MTRHIKTLSESPCWGCEMEEACSQKAKREPKLQDVVLKSWIDADKKKEDCVMYMVLKMEETNG